MLGLDDMLDAYRQVPVCVQQQVFTYVAVFLSEHGGWHYLDLFGLPFGLSASVTAFNRLPALVSACARRVFACITGAYFDDNVTLGLAEWACWSQANLAKVFSAFGAALASHKRFTMAPSRIFIGLVVTLAAAKEGYIVIEPKPGLR